MMPRDVVVKEFFKKLWYRNIPKTPIKFEPFMKRAIKEIAGIVGVNFNPVLYRMYDLKVFEKKGKL